MHKLFPYQDICLNKYSYDWDLYHDCKIYRKRFILLKETDSIIAYDFILEKIVAEIKIPSTLI